MALLPGKEGAFYASHTYMLTITGATTRNVTIADHADWSWANDDNRTIDVWVVVDATSAGVIVGNDDYGAPGNGWNLNIETGTGKAVFEIADGSATTSITGNSDITDGDRHHIVVTYDGTNSELRMWVDGAAQTANPVDTTSVSGTMDGGGSIEIGETGSGGFEGKLIQFVYWDKELSSDEITARYNSGAVRMQDTNGDIPGQTEGASTDILALYHVTEGSGTTLNDLTGNGHDGTIANADQWVTAGITVSGETPSGSGTSYTLANSNVDAVTLYDGGTAIASGAWSITPAGAITLDSAPSGALTADYTHYPMSQIGGFYEWAWDETTAMAEGTQFGQSAARYVAGKTNWTANAQAYWVYPFMGTMLGQKLIIKFYLDEDNSQRYEGWGHVSGISTICNTNELIVQPIQFTGDDALAWVAS